MVLYFHNFILLIYLEQVQDKIDDIESDYRQILSVAPEFKEFSLQDFSEMRMAVSSRIFGIKVNGKKTDCFCPLADMLNHRRPRQTTWYFSDEIQSFIIQSIQNIPAGDEVFDSYGKKCNSRFLLNYGFIVEQNDSNEYPFTIEMNEKVDYFDLKIQFLPNKEFKKIFRVQKSFEENVVLEFMSYIRFICFNEEKHLLFPILFNKKVNQEESKQNFHMMPPFSVLNESLMIIYILNLSNDGLEKYITTIEEDELLLKENLDKNNSKYDKLSFNQKNCIKMRLGEKEILKFFKEFAEYSLELLSMSDVKVSGYSIIF